MAVEMLVGAGLAALFGRQRCFSGCWFLLRPGRISQGTGVRLLLRHKYLRGPSVGQDRQLIPTHLEGLSASLCLPQRNHCGQMEQADSSGL